MQGKAETFRANARLRHSKALEVTFFVRSLAINRGQSFDLRRRAKTWQMATR
jgi:hypothetical protein